MPPHDDDPHGFETPEEALHYLRFTGQTDDSKINLSEAALALGLVFLPSANLDRCRRHLRRMGDQALEEHASRLRMKEKDTALLRAQVLRKILHEAHGYRGEDVSGGDPQNIGLIRTMERRVAAPVAMGILYLALGRMAGWQIDGLSFPAHFLVRLDHEGQRLILDPFLDGKALEAADLRHLLKSVAGAGAELAHHYYTPLSSREILVRLANGIKKRLIEDEEYGQAMTTIETMEAMAPDEYRVLFDKAVLYVRLHQPKEAMRALENYISRTPVPKEKQQALHLLQEIRDSSHGR